MALFRAYFPVVCLLSGSCLGALLGATQTQSAPKAAPLQAILVGGGPDTDNNQAAIEGNIRYLNRLLPPRTPRTVLFADGSLQNETVLFDVESDSADKAQRLWKIFFDAKRPDPDSWVATRAPRLSAPLNGASSEKNIADAFDKVRSTAPLLVFFTGHGGQNTRDSNNNSYNLWGDATLSVREMAQNMARLPRKTPVSLVMVQCYSGAFGNVIFQEIGRAHV